VRSAVDRVALRLCLPAPQARWTFAIQPDLAHLPASCLAALLRVTDPALKPPDPNRRHRTPSTPCKCRGIQVNPTESNHSMTAEEGARLCRRPAAAPPQFSPTSHIHQPRAWPRRCGSQTRRLNHRTQTRVMGHPQTPVNPKESRLIQPNPTTQWQPEKERGCVTDQPQQRPQFSPTSHIHQPRAGPRSRRLAGTHQRHSSPRALQKITPIGHAKSPANRVESSLIQPDPTAKLQPERGPPENQPRSKNEL
jgi:hypothetical protein